METQKPSGLPGDNCAIGEAVYTEGKVTSVDRTRRRPTVRFITDKLYSCCSVGVYFKPDSQNQRTVLQYHNSTRFSVLIGKNEVRFDAAATEPS